MIWALFSLFGAFFQALGSALSKKVLQIHDSENVIGFVSYTVAGVLFYVLYIFSSGAFWMDTLSVKFWWIFSILALTQFLGAWFLYRSLQFAELNYVMPFMTLTSLSLVIPPIFLLGEIPSVGSLFGIMLIVVGALFMSHAKGELSPSNAERRALNLRGLKYFFVTALCFTILPTFVKMAIQESSVLFTSFLSHAFVGFCFLVYLLWKKEGHDLKGTSLKKYRMFFLGTLVVGIIHVLENGSINLALSLAPVAQVFAIKRLMPLFAFFIGFFYFHERDEVPKKILSTILVVTGAIVTILL